MMMGLLSKDRRLPAMVLLLLLLGVYSISELCRDKLERTGRGVRKSKSMTSTWSFPFFSLLAIPWVHVVVMSCFSHERRDLNPCRLSFKILYRSRCLMVDP